MDTLKKYDAALIVNRVIELTKEFPDTVYEHDECLYTKGQATNGRCGCIVGQAIVDVYPELQLDLELIDNRGMVPLFAVFKRIGIDYEGNEQRFLENVQSSQDHGDPWKLCVTPTLLKLIGRSENSV